MELPIEYRDVVHNTLMNPPVWTTALQPVWADFDHPSEYHGLWHTNRVMFHVLVLGHAAGMDQALIRRTYCAAVIHDQARTHDGWCEKHGAWTRATKLPRWTERFLKVGVTDDEVDLIADAVEHHCLDDLPKDHRAYPTLALLKDADALDRYRLGENALDLRFLRHKHARTFAPFAESLVRRCWKVERMDELITRVTSGT